MYSMSVEERMGPGGLDPVEVFESLPAELQECILAAFFFFVLPAPVEKKSKGIKHIEMEAIFLFFGGRVESNLKLRMQIEWSFCRVSEKVGWFAWVLEDLEKMRGNRWNRGMGICVGIFGMWASPANGCCLLVEYRLFCIGSSLLMTSMTNYDE